MLDRVQKWYEEAITEYGDDWAKVERYVQKKVSSMNQVERARLMEEFQAMQPAEAGFMH
ncbi:MAG TPA: hypothetical protein VFI23_12800 [Rhizomicrobium sp.]|nr:hypothetical protein [Rhizomicrobium sp.]